MNFAHSFHVRPALRFGDVCPILTNMLSSMLRRSFCYQIRWIIVRFILIHMMNEISGRYGNAVILLPYKTMTLLPSAWPRLILNSNIIIRIFDGWFFLFK